MTVVVVATIHPKSGSFDAVVSLFEKTIVRVHEEDQGCELYAMHTEADTIVMIEKWSDAAAHQAHLSSPAMNEMNEQVQELLGGKTVVTVLAPRPVGSAKGAL
ncbi:MAG: putative quinol monooxygenase [Nakamurella sp.]